MKIVRRKTKKVKIGSVPVGGNSPISVQSMTKTHTSSTAATIAQIRRLHDCGCEITRLALRNQKDLSSFARIRKNVKVPLVADIHFNYRLALGAIDAGADALRLNPGNIRKLREVEEVVGRAKAAGIPIRVGLNSGSLPPGGKGSLPARMVRTARNYLKIFEKRNFFDILISLKTSDVSSTVASYRLMAKLCPYPFHLGVTASGGGEVGVIKSALGIGTLLLEGIGDTIRVSLTASPDEEVRAAQEILQSLGIRRFHPEIISCPTCGRCEIDLPKIVREVEGGLSARFLGRRNAEYGIRPPKVAIMGCPVNGPGEARDADVGIAGGKRCGLLFKKGKVLRKVTEARLTDALMREISSLLKR